jgi:formate transporter
MDFECKPPAVIAENLTKTVCVEKTRASFLKLLVLGILAGVYIGFGAGLSTIAGHDLQKYLGMGMARLISGSVFTVGLMLVVIGGAELFTGNNLIMLSLLNNEISVWRLLYNWIIVYIANFIGSILFVYLMFNTNLWKMNGCLVGLSALNIANAKVNLSFTEAFTRGILCNWLVCLAVWMAFSSRDITGKIFAVFFPIMAFVASGFEHSVANMYFIPMGVLMKKIPEVVQSAGAGFPAVSNLNLHGFLFNNLIPVTIGNIVGGAFFVATFYWLAYMRKEKV